MFFRHEDSPGGAVTNLLGAQIDFVAFKQKIVIMPDWPFFGCILYNVFGEGSYSVIVSAGLANLIIISEERWKNDEILFQNVYGYRESVVLRVQVISLLTVFVTFGFMGTLA